MNPTVKKMSEQLSFIFDNFKALPFHDEDNTDAKKVTFLAQPRKGDTLEKLQNVLSNIKSDVEVSNGDRYKYCHKFTLGDVEISILYLKDHDNFDYFYDVSSYGINLLLGKILKRANLKLSQDGLMYEEKLSVENHHSKVGHFVISYSMPDILSLMGLDYDTFAKGFSSQDEMFEFVSQSPYLDATVFTQPKKEHKHPIYTKFQAFLILKGMDESKGEKITFEMVDKHFEGVNFLDEVQRLKDKEARKKGLVQKFNGRVILDYFKDFDPKKIGTSMGYFKFSFGSVEEYQDFLIENNIDDIMTKFKEVVKF